MVLAGLLLLTSFPATALAQVAPCGEEMPAITDGRLQAAIEALRARFPDLTFQADDACGRAKATRRALTATLRRNLLTCVNGFEYVKVLDGESYFTIERFRVPKAARRKQLEAAVKKCAPCKLRIPENTCLAHFVAGDSIILMIASAPGCKGSLEKFQLVQQAFLPNAAPAAPQ